MHVEASETAAEAPPPTRRPTVGMFEMKHTKEMFLNQRRIKHELCKRQVADDVTVGV